MQSRYFSNSGAILRFLPCRRHTLHQWWWKFSVDSSTPNFTTIGGVVGAWTYISGDFTKFWVCAGRFSLRHLLNLGGFAEEDWEFWGLNLGTTFPPNFQSSGGETICRMRTSFGETRMVGTSSTTEFGGLDFTRRREWAKKVDVFYIFVRHTFEWQNLWTTLRHELVRV